MEQGEDDRATAQYPEMRISCDDTGALRFRLADGAAVHDDERDGAIGENRGALIDLLERSAAAGEALLRLGDHQPPAIFRQQPSALHLEALQFPPEPIEPDLRPPHRQWVHWLVPPLWRPIREKFKREAYQARQVYLFEHEAWRKDVEEKSARLRETESRMKATYKAEESRFLQQQLRVVKATDRDAVHGSFAAQLRAAPWASLLNVETDLAADCRAASFTIEMPSIDTFESVCPLPCEVDIENLCLKYAELTPRELKRRYDLYVMASTLKVAAVAFVAMPTLDRANVIAEHREADAPTRFVLAHVALSRKVWAAGWKTPDAPMFELNRLRGKFSLAPRAMPAHAV
ncbi:MAG: hypothetical protein ABI846_11460 [Rudaea sp.]